MESEDSVLTELEDRKSIPTEYKCLNEVSLDIFSPDLVHKNDLTLLVC